METLKQKDRTEAEDRGAQGERGGAAEGEEKVKEGAQWRRFRMLLGQEQLLSLALP